MKYINLLFVVFASLLLCSRNCRASVLCGGHYADTCAECPQGNGAGWCNGECSWDYTTGQCKGGQCVIQDSSDSCLSPDCAWHPHTNLCRDPFSDKIRTASVHLNYGRPSAVSNPAWWFQRVIPIASADATYFSTNGHRFGYGGIQQVNENVGRVLFSLWDQGGCDQDVDPNCNADNIAKTVACGRGVFCTGFGGEGTGRKSQLDLTLAASDGVFPQLGHEYYFVTQAVYLGNRRMEYTGYFYLNGEWRLLSRIQVSTNTNEDWSIKGLSSFVEQWSPIDTTKDRGALFGPSFMAPADGSSWHQILRATYSHGTLENHERVNAWQAEADQDYAVGIETGGEAQREVNRGYAFNYPPTKLYDSLEVFSKMIPCLNGATTATEIEVCISCSAEANINNEMRMRTVQQKFKKKKIQCKKRSPAGKKKCLKNARKLKKKRGAAAKKKLAQDIQNCN